MALNACGSGRMSTNSTSSRSPGCAPFTNTGPVSGCTAPASMPAMSATVVVGPSWPSTASRVWRTTSSPALDFDDGRDVGMPSIVALRRLLTKPLAAIDLDALHDVVVPLGPRSSPSVAPRVPPPMLLREALGAGIDSGASGVTIPGPFRTHPSGVLRWLNRSLAGRWCAASTRQRCTAPPPAPSGLRARPEPRRLLPRCPGATAPTQHGEDHEHPSLSNRRVARGRCAAARGGSRAGCPARRSGHGVARHHRPHVVRSVHRPAPDHALRDPLCHPRRARAPAARAQDGREPRRVVVGERGRAHLRVQAAPGPQVPQRRPRHGGRREIQLRALPGRGPQGVAGARPAGGRRRSSHRALPAQGAVAGLHDLLRHHGDRRRARRPQEVRHPGRRRGLPEAPDRRRPLQVREPHARRRGGARGLRGVLAACSSRQASGHEERPRGDHPRGHAEDRRGGHRAWPSMARTPRT